MSLLMQALRKAERARSQHAHDAAHEHEEPQFGQAAVPSPPPVEGGPAFAVMPDAWRLEPLDDEPPVIPAQEAVHDPVPPQARHEPARPATAGQGAGAAHRSGAGSGAGSGTGSGVGLDVGPGNAPAGPPGAGLGVGAEVGPGRESGGGSDIGPDIGLDVAPAVGAAATTDGQTDGLGAWTGRAAASGVQAEPGAPLATGADAGRQPRNGPDDWDIGQPSARSSERTFRREEVRGVRAEGARPAGVPRAIASSQRRLIVLAGALAALLAVFAFIYWRAVSGPGPGARLPMVPMPAPGSAQGAPAGALQGAALPVTPYVTEPAGDSAGMPGAAPVVGGDAGAAGGPPATVAMPGAGALVGAGMGESPSSVSDAQAGTGPAPASKPQANVTIPTPEQLAAIPDPAIRAEAMRDAAERAAQLARTEGVPSTSSAAPAPAPLAAAGSGVPAAQHPSASQAGAADAMRAERPAASGPATKRQSAGTRSGQAARGAAASRANGSGHQDRLQTAVGENGDVRFVRGTAPVQVAPAVQNGYNALKAGDLASARQQYDQALLQDPNNRDALLGSAAVALREHDGRQASNNYLRLLELNPNDPEALAGLAELHPGDLQANEVKLRGLARQHPDSGPVQFALGNLYARQGRWPEAQQSYFRAFSAMPDNADYAFNLAVGLDRLNQSRLAQTYYRRALELAQTSPPAFNIDAVRKRLQALETPPQ
jgi:tetratricopeptide (TPR) repeat protein